jgi:putative glutamine amidotransferase
VSSGPLIAVPTYRLERGRVHGWDTGAFGVPDLYVAALQRAGARAALLPPDPDSDAGELLAGFDGLLLIGGGDVEPGRYGARPHPEVYGIDPERDAFEVAVLSAADRGMTPTLAICRGAQVMNVAFGGTLHQHLPDVPELIEHRGETYGVGTVHEVAVTPQSRLGAAVAASNVRCPSHHHQGIDRLGEGLEPVARSADGLVEAIERKQGWMVGVQWHPEEAAAEDEANQSLFDALAELAADRARAASGKR